MVLKSWKSERSKISHLGTLNVGGNIVLEFYNTGLFSHPSHLLYLLLNYFRIWLLIRGVTVFEVFALPFTVSLKYVVDFCICIIKIVNSWEPIVLRVYAQTSFYQENLAFCFQLCTVMHFVGFLPLPWFSCSLFFFPYSWIRFGRFFVLCMEKKAGLYLIVCKNYNSLTCLNVFFAIFNFDNI